MKRESHESGATLVRVLDLAGLDDLLPSPGCSLVPLALARGLDGREWLVDQDGVPRELLAQVPSTEIALAAASPEGSPLRLAVSLERLRALPIARTVSVREFVVDPPAPQQLGVLTVSPRGAELCLDLLTDRRHDDQLH